MAPVRDPIASFRRTMSERFVLPRILVSHIQASLKGTPCNVDKLAESHEAFGTGGCLLFRRRRQRRTGVRGRSVVGLRRDRDELVDRLHQHVGAAPGQAEVVVANDLPSRLKMLTKLFDGKDGPDFVVGHRAPVARLP